MTPASPTRLPRLPRPPGLPRVRSLTRAGVAGVVGGALVATASPASPARADHADLPPGRTIERHTVQPGDTATALAVRYHAWTAELISHNHLGTAANLRVGDRIEVPVVRSAVRSERAGDRARPRARTGRRTPEPGSRTGRRTRPTPVSPARAEVRAVIVRTARQQGIDPQLALAVSWQEAGWQMHHVSSANAIGAMQVLPTTGTWMSLYAGRDLRLRRTADNVLAGVLLLRVLRDSTTNRRDKIAAYYQGLGAVREHGLYDETKPYVANVLAIKRRLERGLPPA